MLGLPGLILYLIITTPIMIVIKVYEELKDWFYHGKGFKD